MSELRHFNIRVYGLLINHKKEVLLSDEYLLNQYMTKFPGGGLHFGEGPEDCILREIKEEFDQEAEIVRHFYTTGFFQKALFYDDHQLISIYYEIRLKNEPAFKISSKPHDFPEPVHGSQSFRWSSVLSMKLSELSFPIDRHVLKLLKNELLGGRIV
jgi:8-oxo-dGTP diphosphatase